MISFIASLLTWLPAPLIAVCAGVVVIFFVAVILRVVRFILDVIPFL